MKVTVSKEDSTMSDDCDTSFSKFISWHRPRTRSTTTIWSLPEELLLHLLHGMHIKDLLNLRSTHPIFLDLIDHNPSVWARASFQDIWPSQTNLVHFNQAADEANIEALVKLGIAYLYNEGLPGDFEGRGIFTNGESAAYMFCRVESLTVNVDPFTWLFFRPPWSVSGACCKRCVFTNMKTHVARHSDASVEVCIAKTLQLLSKDSEENVHNEIKGHLDAAIQQGSHQASYMAWQIRFNNSVLDKRQELESLRELRNVAQSGSLEAQVRLSRAYGQRRYGEFTAEQAAAYVRNFTQSSRATNVHRVFCNKELTNSMRYILMDWLVEVADMKDFSSLTLHMAISVVDRYLQRRPATRSKLQLVGVAAMVLCSRFLDEEILTIREAAWLTDHTYKYEDVVRTMGEITATLNGHFRVLTSLDYVRVMGAICDNDMTTQCLAEYLCEVILLYSDLSHYKQALLAASTVLLARLIQGKDNPWSNRLQMMTGYSIDELKTCVLALHEKCFVKDAMVDHRNMQLHAVKVRHAGLNFCQVSTIKAMESDALYRLLGLSNITALLSHFDGSKVIVKQDTSHITSAAAKDLITSPSRSCSKVKTHPSPVVLSGSRQQAATPTVPAPPSSSPSPTSPTDNRHQHPVITGARDEENMSLFNTFQDADLESLWCVDQKSSIASPHHGHLMALSSSSSPDASQTTGSSLSTGKYSLNSVHPQGSSRPVQTFNLSSAVSVLNLQQSRCQVPSATVTRSTLATSPSATSQAHSSRHMSAPFTVHIDNELPPAPTSAGTSESNATLSGVNVNKNKVFGPSLEASRRKALQNISVNSSPPAMESKTRNSKRKSTVEHNVGKRNKVHITTSQ